MLSKEDILALLDEVARLLEARGMFPAS